MKDVFPLAVAIGPTMSRQCYDIVLRSDSKSESTLLGLGRLNKKPRQGWHPAGAELSDPHRVGKERKWETTCSHLPYLHRKYSRTNTSFAPLLVLDTSSPGVSTPRPYQGMRCRDWPCYRRLSVSIPELPQSFRQAGKHPQPVNQMWIARASRSIKLKLLRNTRLSLHARRR